MGRAVLRLGWQQRQHGLTIRIISICVAPSEQQRVRGDLGEPFESKPANRGTVRKSLTPVPVDIAIESKHAWSSRRILHVRRNTRQA
jgi:hypothetical protein